MPTLCDGIFSFPNGSNHDTTGLDDCGWDLFDNVDLEPLLANLKPDKVVANELSISGRSPSYNSNYTEAESQADSRSDNPESTDEAPEHIVAGTRGRGRRSSEKRSWGDVAGSQPQRARKSQSTGSSNRPRSPRSKTTLLWRKYGQKILRNKPSRGLVRCYYKCYYPGCPAKKLVEKNSSNLDKIIDTKYEMEHNHPVAEEDYEDSGLLQEQTSQGNVLNDDDVQSGAGGAKWNAATLER